MTSRKKYVLGDFTKYGTGKLATQFAAISNIALYEFSEKLYLDDKNRARRCHMLLVGHYSRKSGGPPVWARATGERICYYSGAGTQVTPLIQDIHSSKVYYDAPFSYIGGSQDYSSLKPGMNPERKLERAVVDSAINFIFLVSGRLEQTLDLMNPDILGSFRLACANLVRHRKPCDGTSYALYKPDLENQAPTSATSKRLRPTELVKSVKPNGRVAHYSKSPVSTSLRKRQFVDLSDDLTGDLSMTRFDTDLSVRLGSNLAVGSNKRARLLEHINNYETEMHAKLERQVRNLGAQLEQQEIRRSATKAKLVREKSRRRAAEGQRDEYWQRCMQRQETSQLNVVQAEAVKEEEGLDWKAMLFEQERRTEHYKLKYIATKEEKATMEARSVEQAIKIGECNRKLLDQEKEAVSLRAQLIDAQKTPKNVRIEYHELAECLDVKVGIAGLTQELETSQADQKAMRQEINLLNARCAVLKSQTQEWEDMELAREGPNMSVLVGTLNHRIQQLESSLTSPTQTPQDIRVLDQRTRIQTLEAIIVGRNIDLRRTKSKLSATQDLKVESMVHQIHTTLSNVKVIGDGKTADGLAIQ